MIGVVKAIISGKNFGFIAHENYLGGIFFIDDKIAEGLIKEGDLVEFEL